MTISASKKLQNLALRMAASGQRDLDLGQSTPTHRRALPPLITAEVIAASAAAPVGARVLALGEVDETVLAGLAAGPKRPGAMVVVDILARDVDVEGVKTHARPLGDLAIDYASIDDRLAEATVTGIAALLALEAQLAAQRKGAPWVADCSQDLILSELTINRLSPPDVARHLGEVFRVLAGSGTALISVLLVDEPAGAASLVVNGRPMTHFPGESEFLSALVAAGFHGARIVWRCPLPFLVVEGVEIRGHVIQVYKGRQGPCWDRGHAVIFKGPWSEVKDDDGHVFRRGERSAVCAKTFALLMRVPYAGLFDAVPCYLEPPADARIPFDCDSPKVRSPRVTKGIEPIGVEATSSECCDPNSTSCCS